METPGSPALDAPMPDNTVPDNPDNTGPDGAGPDAPAPAAAAGPAWRFLIEPRWLGWHLFTVAAVWGMLWLGDWQFHRALSGNGLSWAYTFEWPLFSGFGIVFWARTIRDEFRLQRGIPLSGDGTEVVAVTLPDGAVSWQVQRPADQPGDDADDTELASYNAYLAKLNAKVEGPRK